MPKATLLADRFMQHVSPEPISGCWLWAGHISKIGYGRFGVKNTSGKGHRWQALEAHQVSYSIFVGEPPRGNTKDSKVLDHLCNNRACVNPNHLQVIGRIENVMKGRK